MIKNIAIVSLSKGFLGEAFMKHEVDIGLKRLQSYGCSVKFMPNALKGIEYIKNHPEQRAKDLIEAFLDDKIEMILCAIGGDDTYKLLPYLFENNELQKAFSKKIFLGFSDTTINHFMLHKVGLNTFYGQSFLADIAELSNDMLPYSKKYFIELLQTGRIKEIVPSDIWYSERTKFDETQIGTEPIFHKNNGFELLQGKNVFSGKILGGCIDTIFDMFDNTRYCDSKQLCSKYELFPTLDDWKEKILLLESSSENADPDKFRKMIMVLKHTGIFEVLNGIIVGKPCDEMYYKEYKEILIKEINNPNLPILYNINIGHSNPRCIIPLNVNATVDYSKQKITFNY